MLTREVPREEWASFFDGFSRMYEGRLATVEILGAEIGDQTEARALPLRGVAAETGGGRGDAIEIMVGGGAGGHVTHSAARPARVRVSAADARAH